MKLSIIIPTFNSASVLGRALDSIVSQTFTDWEVLIMDGVSTDNTIETINRIKGKYSFSVRLIKNEINNCFDIETYTMGNEEEEEEDEGDADEII